MNLRSSSVSSSFCLSLSLSAASCSSASVRFHIDHPEDAEEERRLHHAQAHGVNPVNVGHGDARAAVVARDATGHPYSPGYKSMHTKATAKPMHACTLICANEVEIGQ